MSRTASCPAFFTPSELVKVRVTMMPNSTSVLLSTGFSQRLFSYFSMSMDQRSIARGVIDHAGACSSHGVMGGKAKSQFAEGFSRERRSKLMIGRLVPE